MSGRGRHLLAALIAAMAAPACAPSSAPSPTAPPASPGAALTVDADHPGAPLPSSFLGLGFEFDNVLRYTGEGAGAPDPVFLRLLRNVESAGSGPLVWRIGGNSTDYSWWNPAARPRPPGITYDITRSWLESVAKAAAGARAPVIMGVNLALNDPAAAADWAAAVEAALGRAAIDGFEVGNEPDDYPPQTRPRGYSLAQYASDFAAYSSAIRARLGSSTPLAGPAAAGEAFMRGLPDFLAGAGSSVGVVTYHQYPLSVCGKHPGEPAYPTIDELLSEQSSHGLAAAVHPFVVQAAAHRLPLRVAEMNSVVCFGASGVSDTFASALWLADTLFEYASVGVAGVNVQVNTRAFYAPFVLGPAGTVTVKPDYYGLLLVAPALQPGSRLVRVDGGLRRGLKAWATLAGDGKLRVLLLNETRGDGIDLQVRPRSRGSSGNATLARLTAPSLEATRGVTIAGQTFDGTTSGAPSGSPRVESLSAREDGFRFTLPAASAAVLTFRTGG